MNLSEICRICLIKSSKTSEEIFIILDKSFVNKYEEITQTKLGESQSYQYPQKVCISCVTELEQHFNYRNSLIENEKRLKALLGVVDEEIEETLEEELTEEQIEIKFEDETRPDDEEQEIHEEYEENEDSMTEIVDQEFIEEFETEEQEEVVIEEPDDSQMEEGENYEFIEYDQDVESIEVAQNVKRKRKKYSKREQIYACWIDDCEQKFGFRSTIKRHMLAAHNVEITKSTCLLCGSFFDNYNDYLSHIKIHTRNSKCDICMMTFIDDEKLAKHKDRVHNSSDSGRNFECSICKARFKRQEHVNSHMAYKHSDPNDPSSRKFQCSQCPSAFFRRSDLRTHERGHDGVMMKCIYCEYSRRDVKSLKRHCLSAHNSTKLYRCHCDLEFDAYREMQNHKKTCQDRCTE